MPDLKTRRSVIVALAIAAPIVWETPASAQTHSPDVSIVQVTARKMGAQTILFFRQYRAALLDYLLGSGESGRARAYELGRRAIDSGLGLLQILRVHQRAVNTILESTHKVEEGLRRLKASEEFLMETLSPFEMTYRGYVDLLDRAHDKPRRRQSRRREPSRGEQP